MNYASKGASGVFLAKSSSFDLSCIPIRFEKNKRLLSLSRAKLHVRQIENLILSFFTWFEAFLFVGQAFLFFRMTTIDGHSSSSTDCLR